MKLLFLDIDGVLNSGHRHSQNPKWYSTPTPNDVSIYHRGDWVENHKVNMLRNFCARHDVKVVGVSAWFGHVLECGKYHYTDIAKFLGLDIIGVAGTGGSRDTYAQYYVDKWHPDANWAILDDAKPLMDDPNHPKFVYVNGRYGLNNVHIDELKMVYGI